MRNKFESFGQPGRADFIIGGQFGSEGKGAAAAYLAHVLDSLPYTGGYRHVTTNAGAQAGHTSYREDCKLVLRHLPTYPFHASNDPAIYLNAGAIIDLEVLLNEIRNFAPKRPIFIHPNAAIITDEDKELENSTVWSRDHNGSTRKGVGAALAHKVLRQSGGRLARDCIELESYLVDIDLNSTLDAGASVLVEIPQGHSLSLNSQFYPFCTSRDCSIPQAMNDARIHPKFYGKTLMVIRTFPIRVGGNSGPGYSDQKEISWEDIGREPELTTVTGRPRRLFTFSRIQFLGALSTIRPDVVFVTFCDYLSKEAMGRFASYLKEISSQASQSPEFIYGYGPKTEDVHYEPAGWSVS